MTTAPLTWMDNDEIQIVMKERRQNDKDPWKMTTLYFESLGFRFRLGVTNIESKSGTNLVWRLI
jgi:hypothetical protein